MIEVLSEIGAYPREESTSHHHLLLEEQRCVKEQVEFLYAEQEVALVGEQAKGDNCKGQKRHSN